MSKGGLLRPVRQSFIYTKFNWSRQPVDLVLGKMIIISLHKLRKRPVVFLPQIFSTKLMSLVEKTAAKTRMSKVVLTVLIKNVAAVEFYRKLGYTNNEKLPGTCSYRILSRKIKSDPDIELKFAL